MSYVERALQLRPIIEQAAASLPDDVAIEAAELFPAWSAEDVTYEVGARVRYDDLLYKCIQQHNSQETWNPADAVSLWVRIDDPSIEWPEWRQPVGAQDAYPQGAKVSHNDKHWISDVDANVWEPGVAMWHEAE